MTWQRSLLLDILAYGKHYLEDKESSLKAAQEAAYRKAINEILVANSLRLIRFKVSSIEMKAKGSLKIHTSEERVAIVLAVEDGSVDTDELEIELIGLCTDICVVSNALLLKASFPETKISVDASCCAGVTPDTHNAALTTMKMCQINIK